MMTDYAAVYGGFPAPDTPWRLFLAAVARAKRYDARHELQLFDAVRLAIGAALGGSKSLGQTVRDQMVRRAYPVSDRTPVFHPNMFAPDAQEPADA